MAKISLVIADTDASYVDSIVNFLMSNHSQRFQVNSFTNQTYLIKFMTENTKKVDILLISPDMLSEAIPKDKATVLALLSSGRLSTEVKGYPIVNKFQPGDKLVSDLIDLFSDSNKNELFTTSGDKQTKVVAVYSPVGGTGKTTIALAAGTQCALKGMSVFYLNLETVHSTPMIFPCDGDKSLSNILYYLKEKNKNFTLKVEGTRYIDPEFNVHYFLPPESITEMEEVTPEELKTLIGQMRALGQYDMVFVDMSTYFDKRNIAILEACDEILFVLSQDMVSNVKVKTMMREFDILAQKNEINMAEKTTVILNKCQGSGLFDMESAGVFGKPIAYSLPYVPGLLVTQGGKCLCDFSNGLSIGVSQIISKYML